MESDDNLPSGLFMIDNIANFDANVRNENEFKTSAVYKFCAMTEHITCECVICDLAVTLKYMALFLFILFKDLNQKPKKAYFL